MARAMVSVPLAKASNSNTPTGPFQTMVPADMQLRRQQARGLRADVEDQVVVGRPRWRAFTVAGASAAKVLAVTTSTGIGTAAPRALHGLDHGLGFVDQVGLGQRLADLQAGGQHEGVGDAAADDQLVDLVGQRS